MGGKEVLSSNFPASLSIKPQNNPPGDPPKEQNQETLITIHKGDYLQSLHLTFYITGLSIHRLLKEQMLRWISCNTAKQL